jgi:hypothetical protein
MQKSRKSKRRRKVSSLVLRPANIERPASGKSTRSTSRRKRTMQKSRKSKRRRKVSSLVISSANIESPASVVESNKRRRRRKKNLSLKKSHLVKRRMMMMMMMMIEIFLKLKDTLEKLCPLPAFQLYQTSEEVPC